MVADQRSSPQIFITQLQGFRSLLASKTEASSADVLRTAEEKILPLVRAFAFRICPLPKSHSCCRSPMARSGTSPAGRVQGVFSGLAVHLKTESRADFFSLASSNLVLLTQLEWSMHWPKFARTTASGLAFHLGNDNYCLHPRSSLIYSVHQPSLSLFFSL
ncbi:hypothetical protein ABKN59_005262 [Abortiporus biennis]